MIGDAFQPRRRLRASQLNELARSADSAHLGASGFLSQENGLEQVARSPRRMPPISRMPSAMSVECCPAVIKGEGDVPGTYEAELYPYGLGKPPQLKRVHIAITERGVELGLPVGTIVLAHAVAIVTAEDGGDVQQEG